MTPGGVCHYTITWMIEVHLYVFTCHLSKGSVCVRVYETPPTSGLAWELQCHHLQVAPVSRSFPLFTSIQQPKV